MSLYITFPQLLTLLGLILIFTELVIGIQSGFDLVLIGSCLILGGFAGIIFDNPLLALILASCLSLLYIFFGRSFVQKRIIILTKNTNIDKLIGQTGTVIRSITPNTAGMVRLDDEDWRAASDEVLYEKDKIKVI